MFNFISVSSADLFNNLIDLVKKEASFVSSKFWNSIKQNPELNNVHFNFIYGDENEIENAAEVLTQNLVSMINTLLPRDTANDILNDNEHYKMHVEVSRASQLEPEEENQVWAVWESMDAQSAQNERMEMYINEY